MQSGSLGASAVGVGSRAVPKGMTGRTIALGVLRSPGLLRGPTVCWWTVDGWTTPTTGLRSFVGGSVQLAERSSAFSEAVWWALPTCYRAVGRKNRCPADRLNELFQLPPQYSVFGPE